jgi:hypothetical protein
VLQRRFVEEFPASSTREGDLRALALADVVVGARMRAKTANELTRHRRGKESLGLYVRTAERVITVLGGPRPVGYQGPDAAKISQRTRAHQSLENHYPALVLRETSF